MTKCGWAVVVLYLIFAIPIYLDTLVRAINSGVLESTAFWVSMIISVSTIALSVAVYKRDS